MSAIYTLINGLQDNENLLTDPDVFRNHLYINDMVVKNLIAQLSSNSNQIH